MTVHGYLLIIVIINMNLFNLLLEETMKYWTVFHLHLKERKCRKASRINWTKNACYFFQTKKKKRNPCKAPLVLLPNVYTKCLILFNLLQICLTTTDLGYLPASDICCQSSVWVQTNPIIALLEWNPKTRGNIWAQIFLQLSFFLFKHAPELGNFYHKKNWKR